MWLIFNLRKEFKKLNDENIIIKRDLRANEELVNNLLSRDDPISEREVKVLIKEEMLQVREPIKIIPRTKKRIKADKILNKIEIMQEIASMLQKGLSTAEIHNIVVLQKSLIKKTCFYKYLKEVREQLTRTPRTNIAN